jgi:hypothetical protein
LYAYIYLQESDRILVDVLEWHLPLLPESFILR